MLMGIHWGVSLAFITMDHCDRCGRTTPHNHFKCEVCAQEDDKIRVENWNRQRTFDKIDALKKRVEKLERGPVLCA